VGALALAIAFTVPGLRAPRAAPRAAARMPVASAVGSDHSSVAVAAPA